MTIPSMLSGYRKKVVETELKKSFTIISQLVQNSEVDNGSAIYWNWDFVYEAQKADEFWYKYFAPYVNSIGEKRAHHSDKSFYQIYAANGEGPLWAHDNIRNAYWHELPDGSSVILSIFGRENILFGTFDVIIPASVAKRKLVTGKDVFAFAINPNKDKASVSVFPNTYKNWSCNTVNQNRDRFKKYCNEVDYSGSGIYPASYCTMLIYCNGWKIPDDYPIKF